MIDVNVNSGQWPFRRLPDDETPRLVARLKQAGVTQAWAGSFEGLLHRDLAAVNARLADACRQSQGLLFPFGSVNPLLPDWQGDLRRCQEEHRMPGIRLHPNYHGYELGDERFGQLLEHAERRGLIVQIALKMEDERTQHPLGRVPTVDPRPLVESLRPHPGLRVVLLNALRELRVDDLALLTKAGQVYFDISMLEGVGGLEKLVAQVPFERVLFGSHFPLFYFEAALLKLRESELPGLMRRAIEQDNARRLLGNQERV